jgi:hypothetical protein
MQSNSTKRSIKEIHDILNHRSNVSVNGQPPYNPLPIETVELLNKNLERLKNGLAEYEKVRKEDLKQHGLTEKDESYQLKPIQIGKKYRYLFREIYKYQTESILLEPMRFEPKLLKTRPHKKSDGWRQANKNQRKPVY